MADIDNAVEEIEQGNAWDKTDEVVRHLEVKKPLDKVIPLRLHADKWEQMREEAKVLGVGPTTLARCGFWSVSASGSKHKPCSQHNDKIKIHLHDARK